MVKLCRWSIKIDSDKHYFDHWQANNYSEHAYIYPMIAFTCLVAPKNELPGAKTNMGEYKLVHRSHKLALWQPAFD
jgi:hypothetical protein